MKNITLVLCSFLFIGSLYAQQIIPMDRASNQNKIRNLKKILKDSTKQNLFAKTQEEIDSLKNNGDRVFIYGFGSSDMVNLEGISTNGGFSFAANIGASSRLFLSIGIGADIIKKEKVDSVNINSIFFPDNASSIINGYYEHFIPLLKSNEEEVLGYLEGAFQSRNIEGRDSVIHNFGIFNGSIGVKYRWKYEKGSNTFRLDGGLAYGYLEIAKQSKTSFETLTDTSLAQNNDIPTIYRGINGVISIQYNDVNIYARGFFPLSANGSIVYNHNFYFSTGVKVSGAFFGF